MKKFFFLIIAVSIIFFSCSESRVYDHYAHTPISGWEKNDTLVFNTDTIRDAGTYSQDIGLRINSSYPFMAITLVIDQTVYPEHTTKSDTINCNLIDKNGRSKGLGISYYQYSFPISDLDLKEGDSVVVRIRHDMKREILPGISDIGYMLTKH